MKRIIILGIIVFGIFISFAWSAEPDHFSLYSFPADGFQAAFPQKPLEFRIDRGLSNDYSNSYQAVIINPISQYSVFVSHSPKRVFDNNAIDAYLEGIVSGLIKSSDGPVLEYTRKIKFHGFPSIEYKYTHKIEGVSVIGRGIVLIVEGEHIRLSQIYTMNDYNAEKNFKKFIGLFRLISLDIALSEQRFYNRTRSISFTPPDGWQLDTSKFAPVIALFTNPSGHSIIVLDSSTPSYKCNDYKLELQATQGIQGIGEISARGRTITWLKSTAYNSAAKIKMTSIHYCVNTTEGAVIMSGVAPYQTFFRSEIIFRNAATSMEIRK